MADLHVGSHAAELAGDVHEAAEVARHQRAGAALHHGRGLALDDGVGQLAVFHREGAAEAAAHVGVLGFDEVEAPHGAEQAPRLLADAELAQARTGVVVGHRAVEGGIDAADAHHVGQEGHELVGAGGQLLRLGQHVGIVGEELGIVALDHAGAGAGGRDDVVVAREGPDHLRGDGRGGAAVPGIVGGLPAAGLTRHIDEAARVLQQLDGREPHGGTEQVHQAGDEEPDPYLAPRAPARCCRHLHQAPRASPCHGSDVGARTLQRQCGKGCAGQPCPGPARSPASGPGRRHRAAPARRGGPRWNDVSCWPAC